VIVYELFMDILIGLLIFVDMILITIIVGSIIRMIRSHTPEYMFPIIISLAGLCITIGCVFIPRGAL